MSYVMFRFSQTTIHQHMTLWSWPRLRVRLHLTYNLAFADSHPAPGPYVPAGTTDVKDVKVPYENTDPQTFSPPAGPPPSNIPSMPATTVYNYRNEFTGEVVCSLLPPDHPQMICLQHGHIPRSRFSVLGTFCCQFLLYQCTNYQYSRCSRRHILVPSWYRYLSPGQTGLLFALRSAH